MINLNNFPVIIGESQVDNIKHGKDLETVISLSYIETIIKCGEPESILMYSIYSDRIVTSNTNTFYFGDGVYSSDEVLRDDFFETALAMADYDFIDFTGDKIYTVCNVLLPDMGSGVIT